MASDALRFKILKHLAAGPDTWTSMVEKVSAEVGSQFFVEQALKSMVESGEIVRASDSSIPTYKAPGPGEGKYAGFNDKRLEGPYAYQPEKEPLTPYKAV